MIIFCFFRLYLFLLINRRHLFILKIFIFAKCRFWKCIQINLLSIDISRIGNMFFVYILIIFWNNYLIFLHTEYYFCLMMTSWSYCSSSGILRRLWITLNIFLFLIRIYISLIIFCTFNCIYLSIIFIFFMYPFWKSDRCSSWWFRFWISFASLRFYLSIYLLFI